MSGESQNILGSGVARVKEWKSKRGDVFDNNCAGNRHKGVLWIEGAAMDAGNPLDHKGFQRQGM